jgi:hypothetical protein
MDFILTIKHSPYPTKCHRFFYYSFSQGLCHGKVKSSDSEFIPTGLKVLTGKGLRGKMKKQN